MRAGMIELKSGRWHWILVPRWTGATVLLRHRERIHDEMRSWTAEEELTDSAAREVARDSQNRTWLDADGLKWLVTIELPFSWLRGLSGQSGIRDSSIWLVFQRGGLLRRIAVPAHARLGDLSHLELRDLLERASRQDATLSS